MGLEFVTPGILFVIPLGIAYLVWVDQQSYISFSRGRRRAVLAVRATLLTALSFALSRPQVITRSRMAPAVLLVDVSQSVSDSRLDVVKKFVGQVWAARSGRRLEVVTFAGHPRRAQITEAGPVIARHDADQTNLAEAIDFARGVVTDGSPRMVLIGDGFDTQGDAVTALERAVAAGGELDVTRLGSTPRDARVKALRLPDTLRRNEPARISVVVEATQKGRASVRLEENNLLLQEKTVELTDGSQTVEFDFAPTLTGLVRYGAEIRLRGDEIPGNDRYVQLASVAGPPRVLLATNSPEESTHLEETLMTQEVAVESISPSSLPSMLEGLLGYDEVILVGIAPMDLDPLRQGALLSYVRDTGGGLVMVSGTHGLRRDPEGRPSTLEGMLPVTLAAPSERQQPPVAIALLVDRSGSMVGEKLDYAKQAARAVVDRLTPHDQVGVIGFDSSFDWVVPLSSLENKEAVKTQIGAIGAGGGTRFYPALEEAYFALGSAEAAVRHIILLTDGDSTDPDIFPQLMAKARSGAITVSTVAIGHQADIKRLGEIARLGGGRFTMAANASEVPNIFVKETETVQRDAAQHRDTYVTRAANARELAGIDFHTAPPLKGYLRTRAKASSETLLVTSPGNDPLLVRWHYGLGTVAAFTSDATTAWSELWLTQRWPGYGKLWTQLVRAAQRPRSRHDLSLSIRPHDDRIDLRVDALDTDGRFIDDLEVRVRVIDSEQQSHEPLLEQVGPGRYAGTLKVPLGSVLARPRASRGGRGIDGDWVILARPYSAELASVGPNEAGLSELARAGRGASITSPDQVVGPGQVGVPHTLPLGVPLALLSLLLFLIDVSAKRARWELRP
jgi:uncharacterized membrane protein/uncharacterized protein YegL